MNKEEMEERVTEIEDRLNEVEDELEEAEENEDLVADEILTKERMDLEDEQKELEHKIANK